ncbi:HDIG domain-containing protein [Thermosipho ferrireducens]|uniref:HDIG domain-containing protein n=1 Tax=Thermosipho ferrireducens TaxID=2571116 RepID=A0ABX7S6G7_9BACT|nr:HDIG domain-containing metalloprotein [Thermosipho ferrireducens]QTA38164.1 HDIG domain-containing protein [Thermosipho ferrireducens]
MKKINELLKKFDYEGIIVSLIAVLLLNLYDFRIDSFINEYLILIFIWYVIVGIVFKSVYHFHLAKVFRYTFHILFLFGIIITYPVIDKFGFTLSPFLISPLLLTLLMSYEVGITAGVIQALLFSIHRHDPYLFIYLVPQILLMNYIVRNINRRIEIARSAFFTGILGLVTLIVQLNIRFYYINYIDYIAALINPFVSTVFIFGFLPYIEYSTRIYSNIGLSELGNINHPLLKQLSIQAPGTYYHSIMVANLAEAAAESIGANSTFVRVASYFHDIGKMKRPYFFTENIPSGDENPHDNISPYLSHIILEDHIKSGIELVRKYRLPLRIEFIIPQHHGNRVQKYFYYKAQKIDFKVSEDAFRYPGPKPQFKEAGIIMLADSVEAAIKSLKSANYQKIKEMVENIVSGIYNERQLDESGLTLKDLEIIIEEFIKVIVNITRTRIEYPKEQVQKVVQINDIPGE